MTDDTPSSGLTIMTEASTSKIPLDTFLKILTNNNVPPTKAIAVTGKMLVSFILLSYTCNSPICC